MTEGLLSFVNHHADVYLFGRDHVAIDGPLLVAMPITPFFLITAEIPSSYVEKRLAAFFQAWRQREHLLRLPLPAPTGEKKVVRCQYCPEKTCSDCNGAGAVECPECGAEMSCEHCDGKGYINLAECEKCRGSKRLSVNEDITMDGAVFDGERMALLHKKLTDVKGAVFHDLGLPASQPALLFRATGGVWGGLLPNSMGGKP